MILYKKGKDLTSHIKETKSHGLFVGFVPTMGALHAGHISLVEAAKKQTGLVVCSIFVNPTQFNDANDFQKYPITIEKDIYLLGKKGPDILFLPDLDEIFPQGTRHLEHYDLGNLETILEGQYRPGHFQGVCQVMRRLLEIVQPHQLYMGQKDFQQCLVIRKLLSLMQSVIELHTCPTQREKDGLAMSSRNVHLTPEERKKARAIFEALTFLKKNIQPGNLNSLLLQASALLIKNDFRVDYVEIADSLTLEPVREWNGQEGLVALAAAFQQDTRLIDNMVLTDEIN